MQMLSEAPTLFVALVMVAGTFSSWLAWRFTLPVVPLLLAAGAVLQWVGVPGLSLKEPVLAMTLIGIGFMAMFYQGGTLLRTLDLASVRHEVQHLAAMGPKLGWVLTALAAKVILGVSLEVGFLLGALLLVGAPYAVEGLAGRLRATKATEAVLSCENYVVGCVGTAWAILVCQCIVGHHGDPSVQQTLRTTVLTALVGGAYGCVLAGLLVWLRPRVPDTLWNPTWLSVAVLAFSLANRSFMGSGVVTAALAGYLASRATWLEGSGQFGRDVSGLMLNVLGIVVGVLIPWSHLGDHWAQRLLFCAFVLALRPLLVWVACRKSPMPSSEKRVLSLVAPRGILTMALTVFVLLRLHPTGFADTLEVACTVWWVVVATNMFPWVISLWGPRQPQGEG